GPERQETHPGISYVFMGGIVFAGVTVANSIQFSCGGTQCPVGQDCISVGGTLGCADPCQHYTALNDDWRATTTNNNNQVNGGSHCDQSINFQGWYRLFLGHTSVQMPERCVEINMCGTHAPMWLTEPHPQLLDGVVQRGVCGSWSGDCCLFQQTPIHVKACYGNYYVYKFVPAITCNLAYCADINTKVCSTCRDDDTCMSEDKITWRCERKGELCGQSIIQVGLNRAHLKAAGLNASTAHLADPRCSAHEDRNGTVWYQVERREGRCGNTLETNTTHAVYSNSLFVYPVDGRNDSLSRPVSYPFSCVYPLETESSLDVALRPYLLNSRGAVGVGAKARASMFLYRNSNYTESYPAGEVLLPIGSSLRVGVSVEESGMDMVCLMLSTVCVAVQTFNPLLFLGSSPRCPTNRTQVTVEESGSSLRARFSALLQGDYRYIFLHCSLSLCDQGSSSCIPVSPLTFVVGFSDVVVGFSDGVVGFSDVVVGFSDVVVGLSDVVVGLSDVVVGLSDVVVGLSDVVVGLFLSTGVLWKKFSLCV
uniref:ZP domain-containing protein n=1 Tax=Salmo trutta TaxID=8032 RepID=A0A673WK96_SALTR